MTFDMPRIRCRQLMGRLGLMLALAASGCGGSSVDRYVPETTAARQSLETALNAWQSGEKLKTIETDAHKIDVFDARWRNGAKLEKYEILSEQTGEAYPTFLVKTRIKGKDEDTKYIVVGIDPILVFREQEYQKASGM